ncbi:unnamed protein product, partial [Scytosiphon promiscuus]
MDSKMSIEDVSSLTVPKLKAELTRLNQPLGGLKRKAQLVEALTAYLEKEQQQQDGAAPSDAVDEGDDAPAAAAESAEEAAAGEQQQQEEEPAQEEPPAASEEAEPMDVAADPGNGSAATAGDTVQQEEPAAEADSPAQTPTRRSRKRTARVEDEAAATKQPKASAKKVAAEDGDEEQQRPHRGRTSPAAKRKKSPAVKPSVADTTASPPPQEEEKQEQPPRGAETGNGNVLTRWTNRRPRRPPSPVEPAAPASAEPVAAAAPKEGGQEGGGGQEGDDGDDAGGATVDPVTIRVDNFVRPFTAPQAKKLLEDSAGAPVLEGGFWMDSIKTHCYATFDGKEAAEKAIAALQGLQWPVQSFKKLEAKMGDMSAAEAKERDDAKRSNRPYSAGKKRLTLGPRVTPDPAGPGAKSLPAGKEAMGANGSESAAAGDAIGGRVRGRGSVQAPGVAGAKGGVLAATVEAELERGQGPMGGGARQQRGEGPKGKQEEEEEPIVLDDMFRKTDAKPSLYWLPLSEEEVGARKKKMEADGVGPRTTPMPADHIEAAIGGG